MRRIMIIGQPGSGKSTLARLIGQRTGLPVVHIDHIHWQSGWLERPRAEKACLCAEVEARDDWVFEGGFSHSWPNRLSRADLLIWLDVPLPIRMWRVLRRHGRHRPDLPAGCTERLDHEFLAFLRFIWRTRRTSRQAMMRLTESSEKPVIRLRSARDTDAFLETL